jgi:hypothetical protein
MAADFWRAVASVRLDRDAGLHALEAQFAAGTTPTQLDGPLRGHFLAFTVGHHADRALESLAHLWMPWKGKTFDSATNSGRNVFSSGARALMRLTMPNYQPVDLGDGRCAAFAFDTSVGPSALNRGTEVLRIDYRDVPANPKWPVRKVLDELVDIGDGIFLGQALMEFRGSLRRAAWFSLER